MFTKKDFDNHTGSKRERESRRRFGGSLGRGNFTRARALCYWRMRKQYEEKEKGA